MNEEHTTNWQDIVSKAIYAVPAFFLLLAWINKYFSGKSEERATFIKAVVKEAMDIAMQPIKDEMKTIRESNERAVAKVNDRIDELFKENRK